MAGPTRTKGDYSTYLETKQSRLQGRGCTRCQAGQKRLEPSWSRVRSNTKGRPGQEQGPARPLRGDGHRGREDAQAQLRGDPQSHPGPDSGALVVKTGKFVQGYGDRLLIDQ